MFIEIKLSLQDLYVIDQAGITIEDADAFVRTLGIKDDFARYVVTYQWGLLPAIERVKRARLEQTKSKDKSQ